MKKIINVCVCFFVCLSLFVFNSSKISAFVYDSSLSYKVETLSYDYTPINSLTTSTWGSSFNFNSSKNVFCVDVYYYNPIEFTDGDSFNFYSRIAFAGSSILSKIKTVYAKIEGNSWKQVNFVKPYGDFVSCEGILKNSSGITQNILHIRYELSDSYSIPTLYFTNDILEVALTETSSLVNSLRNDLNNTNSEISDINNSVNGLYTSFGVLQQDFVTLNNDIGTGLNNVVDAVGTVSAGIGTLGDTIESGIGTIFGGITTLISNSGSIKDMVRSIADSVASLDLNFMNWWNEYISNYTYVLMALNNINSSIQTYCGQIINDLGIINSSMYTCTNAVTSTMNAMNRDIQEQMIAQGNGINSSIKTMETAIVTKLNDTLVVNDKTGIQNNDSVTEDLDSAINDYDSVEQGLVTDFNDSLDSLDTDSASNIYNQNDFVRTTTFISTNMQNIYESNDFIGGFIDLTLLLGLIFIVIGIGVK